MIIVQICVGSSCHLKGSEIIVKLMQEAVEKYNLDGEVVIMGNFCVGECNRSGVTVTVDDEVITGVTKENFNEFFQNKILNKLGK